MAKAKKKEAKKGEIAKAAAKTGKLAAQVERYAREAVDRAVHASAIVADAFGKPEKVVGAIGSAASDSRDAIVHVIDERLKATISGLGLATLDDVRKLSARIAALEVAKPKARKAPAKKAAVKKAAVKKAPAKKPAARKAPARRARAKK